MRREIGDIIIRYHGEIDLCLSTLQLVSAEETAQWQKQAKQAQEEDHVEIMEGISSILGTSMSTLQQVTEFRTEFHQEQDVDKARWQQLMDLLQEALQTTQERERDQENLENILANVTRATGGLPSDDRVRGKGREVRITNPHAVKQGENYDVYVGEYLGQFPVACKKLRNVGVKEKNFERFWRHSRTWREVWEKDQGAHILKYIGTVDDDGPYPYMVSPWQENGTILEWVQKNPNCDRLKLIYGVAEGVKVLHSWSPHPIIHGGIRAENVFISDEGNPLLADFSLSKVLESVKGIECTNSKGISSYYRWCAPEFIRSNTFTKESDIFAFGMTTLEIITGVQPFGNSLTNTQVIFNMCERVRPDRPENVDDTLWSLITDCWAHEPERRPDIDQVLLRLKEMMQSTDDVAMHQDAS